MKSFSSCMWLICLGAVAGGISAERATAGASARPNVILIMSDDQGYGDFGCLGNRMIHTPNLDRLHGESVRFTDFHVDPTCSPTRSALMTGHYSARAGCWHTIAGRSLLFHDQVTLGNLFQSAGYRTAVFGKWHLGDNYPMRPQDRGFDETLVLGGGGVTQTPDWWGNDYFGDTYLRNGRPEVFSGYCTDVFFDEALQFIHRNRNRPFFVYLPTNVAHGPYNVADRYSRPYREKGVPKTMANFYGMLENLDENIGRLREKLVEWSLDDNTLLLFLTDNGTAEGAHPRRNESGTWPGYNAGMRGQKGSQYEGGHRVPLFVRWPAANIGGGRDVDRLTAHLDIAPTLVELCGLKPPAGLKFDGRSLAPLLRGEEADWPQRTLFVAVQRQEIPPKWVRSAVMTERWRLVDGKELYDLPADPGQQHDVAAAHADVVARLRAKYEQWWADLEPSFAKYGYIVVGDPHENPARITCHDWHANYVPWHQGLIRSNPWANGYWMLKVARAGHYEFTLRQWPKIAEYPIQAATAKVRVGKAEATCAVAKGATAVTLGLDLPAGPAKLQTWFHDPQAGKSRGAFFITVRRVDDGT